MKKITTLAQRRAEVSYSTSAKSDRCSTCAMCSASKLKHQAARSDRHCVEIDAPVSASGTCTLYIPGRNNDMPTAGLGGLAA